MNNHEIPAFRLASIIVDRLIQERLLRPDRRDLLIEKISMGRMKENDWNLEIDLAVAKESSL